MTTHETEGDFERDAPFSKERALDMFSSQLAKMDESMRPAVVSVMSQIDPQYRVSYSLIAHASTFDMLIAANALLRAMVEKAGCLELAPALVLVNSELEEQLEARLQRKRDAN